jgi:hypothetical protein
MKRLFSLAVLLTFHGLSPAQVPRMSVRGNDGSVKLLQVEQAAVSVQVLGDVAETVLDLNFRNDGDRAVEGEFVLPLPEGATVSSYALEVNGRMRDGVAVERERARTAYETVKRRLIDPGIVEREAGNVYRTNVYPVPARGTKRLRITYNETLRSDGGGFAYALPLDFPDSLNSFSCELRGDGIQVSDAAGLSFTSNAGDSLKAVIKNGRPSGILKLAVPAVGEPRMIVESETQPAFFLSARPPGIASRPRPLPGSVMLVWDASASRAERDHTKEIALLDAWFAHVGKTRVKLHILRDRLADGGEFEVQDGRWPELRKVLEQIDYDGATDLSRVQVSAGQADLVLLVGDGLSTLGSKPPAIAVPWFFIHTGANPPSKLLMRRAEASGGGAILLATDDPALGLSKLTHAPLRLLAVVGHDVSDVLIDQSTVQGQPLRIFGTLKESRAGKLELRYAFGDEIVSTREVIYQPGGSPAGMVRRLHAQRTLAELELQDRPDRKRIIEHCKRHGLVSDFTSLIVLERIEDYAEHRIPPPEPELQDEYRRLVEARERLAAGNLGGLSYAWSAKLAWYGRAFPGYEALILPRLRQVAIWKKAVDSLFTPAQRDAKAYGTVAAWFDKAAELVRRRPELRTKEDYAGWTRSIDELRAQGPELAKTPVQAPPAGQPLTVSVRGLVVNPGLVTGASGMTLKQAIEKAGGVHPLGRLDHVALYRNAGKIVYNTVSKHYQDIAMLPGDMVVVSQPSVSMSDVDPFSESMTENDPLQAPAVSEAGDVWTDGPDRGASAGGDADAFASKPGVAEESVVREVVVRELPRTGVDGVDFKAFESALAAKAGPEAAYRKLKGGRIYQPKFYQEAARILFAANHPDLARRVLSNLVEWRPGEVAALRGYAFWLAEFGQGGDAAAVLESVSEDSPGAMEARLDLGSIRAARGEPLQAVEAMGRIFEEIRSHHLGGLAAIALTEINACHGKAGPERGTHPLAAKDARYHKNLEADIRIVLSAADAGGGLAFQIKEPGGFTSSSGGGPSAIGGDVTAAGGIREYMIRHAVPGVYQISCSSRLPTTVRCAIHTDWGRPNQRTRVVTAWLERDKTLDLGEVRFEFRGP